MPLSPCFFGTACAVNLPTLFATPDTFLRWRGGFCCHRPQVKFILHGKPAASAVLLQRVATKLGWAYRHLQPLERVALS